MKTDKIAIKKVLNKKTLIIGFITLMVIIIACYFLYNNSSNKLEKICIENKACFSLEIADNSSERQIGLSGRNFLDNNTGMLFVFEQEILPSFWMKDMNFPIDIIWINKNKKIIGIEKSIQLCGEECPIFYPDEKIKYALEINSKLSEFYGFEKGDSVYF